jgi:hypothetical protein
VPDVPAIREELQNNKSALILYLKSKLSQSDWHACQDAASDIREIDAKLELLMELTR